MQLEKEDGTSVTGKIIIIGTANISSWATGENANKNVIVKGYNEDSKINMNADWELQGNTTITDVKIVLYNNNNIYANGHDLVLGTKGNKESLKIGNETNKYYPNVYGGSKSTNINNTNVTIHSGTYENIYGGSKGKNIINNTKLHIEYAVINDSIYGGSNGLNIGGNIDLKIEDAILINGSISGAGNTDSVTGIINLNIEKITLKGNNSIYGYGYNGGTTGSKNNINIKISSIIGTPKYVIGYSYTNVGGIATDSTINMDLSNIDSSDMEIYGGSYNGTQTKAVIAKITTNNVKAKLLSPGGIVASSIKNYDLLVKESSFIDGIYAGIGINSTANVVDNSNTLNLSSYYGRIFVNNRTATITLTNSNVIGETKFYSSNISLINSKLSIESINSTSSSLGNISIDKTSTLSINNTNKLYFNGTLSGNGTLELCDTTNLTVKGGIGGEQIHIDIIENENNSNHYVVINSLKEENEQELVSAKNEQGTDKYQKSFIGHMSYWEFYTNDPIIKSQTNCVYVHAISGDDNNEGTIEKPLKSIAKASELILASSNPKKDRVVIISDFDLNKEDKKDADILSEQYTLITSTDGNIDFAKAIMLNSETTNIYQNLKFENIRIQSNSANQKRDIYINNNKLIIGNNVSTNVKFSADGSVTEYAINIFGGTNNVYKNEINNYIEINSGNWNRIMGGTYYPIGSEQTNDITGAIKIVINGGKIYNIFGGNRGGTLVLDPEIQINGGNVAGVIYGGSHSGEIVGNTNINMTAGTVSFIVGGNYSGDLVGTTNINVTGGKINNSIYGGNRSDNIIENDTDDTSGSSNITIEKGTIVSSIYGASESAGSEIKNTNITINGGTISYLYGGGRKNTSVKENANITINGGKIENVYGGSIEGTVTNTNVTITRCEKITNLYGGSPNGTVKENTNITISEGNIGNVYAGAPGGTVDGTTNITIKDNKEDFIFNNRLEADNFNIINSKIVTANEGIKVNKLSLNEGTYLRLEKQSEVGTFEGTVNETNYGKIEVLNGLQIGHATGKTKLLMGTITEYEKPYSQENVFVAKLIQEEEPRIWSAAQLLDTVYLDGKGGNDENSGENPENALATLEQAYSYLKENGGKIVICGPTTITKWPKNTSKKATITSFDGNVDYRNKNENPASLNLNCSDNLSSVVLQADTTFENIILSMSKTQNIYANGKKLVLGESISSSQNFLNIYGGHYSNNVENTNVNIISGSYNNVYGGGAKVIGDITISVAGASINNIKSKENSKNTSNGFNLTITNASVENVYYEPDKITQITLSDEANVKSINAETYSNNNTNVETNININTTNPVNIDGKNKGNTNINFKAVKLENYTGNIINVARVNIEDEAILNIEGIENEIKFGALNLNVKNNSELIIGEKVTTLTFGNIVFDDTSTIKIYSNLRTINVNGDFNGGGKLYLNDGVQFDITGKVINSTKIYCNNETEYFSKGTIIIATASEESSDASAFITPNGENWFSAKNDTKRIWQTKEFTINHIVYVNSKIGTSYGLGTKDTPVDTLENAYKIANKRYSENNEEKKYYILLQENLTITNPSIDEKLNENIEVIITNKVASEDIEYNTTLNINTPKFDFIGKTTIENITINTTGYNTNSVEFFGNGNNVTFGNGITINSPSQKYPIIYGGAENFEVNNEINLTVSSGTYNMIFGGGKNKGADVNSNINITVGTINLKGYAIDEDECTGIFGAGRNAIVTGNVNLIVNSGEFYRIYGAGLNGTLKGNVDIKFNGGTTTRLYGGGQRGEVDGNVTVKVAATVTDFLRGSGQYTGITGSTQLNIYSGAILSEKTQVAAGGYQGNVSTSKLNIYGGTIECDVYGGGWGIIGDSSKGQSDNSEVYIYENTVINGDIYGGGYAGPTNNTNVTINKAIINNVYGGGNEAEIKENTSVKLIDAVINESAYGGGKGVTATVNGDSTVVMEGTTVINENLFGGGNASMNGLVDNNSTTNVYIIGGTIKQDVYGGANTSIVYGNTNVKIGKNAVAEALNIEDFKISPINIKGTVFGGGKSNTAGSEDYDFTFESVTGNVNIDIDSKDIELNIGKSVFASGNAAKISGNGYVRISNYGTYENPKKLISIQRATEVTLDNSSLWILGTTDRTNEISTIKYTINRVNKLKLKNNSTLYLENGVNILEKLESLDENGNLEYININENGTIQQNVNNRLFLLHGKNMILLAEDGSNGSVHGMIFLGKFDSNKSNGKIEKGIYSYNQGEIVDEDTKNKLVKSSYLQAQHYSSHNITKDGFYTNNITEESKINVQYIIPTPEDATYYQWVIGKSEAVYYGDIELVASKYTSTAQVTLDLVGLNAKDMILDVKNIDTSLLDSGVILKDESQIPNMAEDANKANTEFALTMENGYQGWKANGKTNYLYQYNEKVEDNKFGIVQGTTSYYSDKSNTTPTLTFNLLHSKNISEGKELGKVIINLIATYIEDGASISRDVIIELVIRTAQTSSDIEYYEGAITPGLKYGVFPSSTTNITSRSAISTYYSIYLENYDTTKYYENYEGYYHALSSSFVLPKGTKIVMIDKSNNTDKYYYYIVTSQDEQNDKRIYKFTDFTAMGTLNQKYNNDSSYYNSDKNYVLEEFIVQLNFENSNITKNHSRENLKLQLMDAYDDSIKLTVNDAIYPMMYNIYCNQEPQKSLNIENKETIHLYEPDDLEFTINANYIYQIENSNIVYDTTNFDNAEGLKIIFNLGEKQLTKAELGGISATYNGTQYFVNEDGSISFKIADVVSNIESKFKLNLSQKNDWKPGTYTIKVEAIASADGVNASKAIASDNILIIFSSNEYGLDVILDNNSQVIDRETGKTLNDNNILNFGINYAEGLANPKIRVALYRRDYENVYSPEYNLVDLKEFVINDLKNSKKEKEYVVTDSPKTNQEFVLNLKENLMTGTYKVKFLVYDGENYIGEVYKMIIIK